MRTLAAILALTLLAGCLGNDAPETDVETSSAGATIEPSVIVDPTTMLDPAPGDADFAEAPVWRVGDAWSIQSSDGETSEQAYLVVTEAAIDAYTLETTSDQLAGYDAMFDVSYLGKIRARDLAGHQQGEPIVYFDFPLEDGKTWSTVWDGSEIVLTATRSTRGFDIVGTREGETYVTYDYVPDLKWWSTLTFTAGYGITIDRLEANWTGELSSATAKLVFEGGPAAPVATPASGTFTIDEGQATAMLTIHLGGAAWARTLRLFDPTGAPHMTRTPDLETSNAMEGSSGAFHQEALPPTPGEWRIVAPAVHDPDGGGFVTVHQVSVTKRPF